MVQLKGTGGRSSSTTTEFQFLMVQLKEKILKKQYERNEVSIPYGTIKRLFSFVCSVVCSVFQFLMVQLKDWVGRIHRKRSRVSIPYGTIKRVDRIGCHPLRRVSIPFGTIKSSSASLGV